MSNHWIRALQSLSGDEPRLHDENPVQILYTLFRGVVHPEIFVSNRGRISLPERFSIKLGLNRKIYDLLSRPDIFNLCPMQFRKSFLDLTYLIIKKEIYDVVKFECYDSSNNKAGLMELLLRLLESNTLIKPSDLSISKRILHLIGLVGTAGISLDEFKYFLSFLKQPSELTVSTLQALKLMIKLDHGVVKASPSSIFIFGGPSSGLLVKSVSFLFSKEYQFCTWFRIESFTEDRKEHNPSHKDAVTAFNSSDHHAQHIFCWQHIASKKGLDFYIDNKVFTIGVINNVGKSHMDPMTMKLTNVTLRKGVWYHLSIRHSKPKFALFGNDELVIHLDHQLVFQDTVRFPVVANAASECTFEFGRNFDGFFGPIYLFNEALSPNVVESIGRIDAGKGSEGIESGQNPIFVDLLPTITPMSDRKSYPINSKITMAYHPTRCVGGYALDIHNGYHGEFGRHTHVWNIVNVRELLSCMGGVTSLLPLFPKLLIKVENYSPPLDSSLDKKIPTVFTFSNESPTMDPSGSIFFPYHPVQSPLGTSIADLNDSQQQQIESLLDISMINEAGNGRDEFKGENTLGLLLAVLSKCITSHRPYQHELLTSGGIEMIEYVLSCTPQEILQLEGEACVLSLIQLKSAAVDYPLLESRITKCLLCNISAWSRASFQLISSLMSVILAAIKAQPDMFKDLLGVHYLLQSLEHFHSTPYRFELDTDLNISSTVVSKPVAESNSEGITHETPIIPKVDLSKELSSEVTSANKQPVTNTNEMLVLDKISPTLDSTKIDDESINESEVLSLKGRLPTSGETTKLPINVNTRNGSTTNSPIKANRVSASMSNIHDTQSLQKYNSPVGKSTNMNRLKSFKMSITAAIGNQDEDGLSTLVPSQQMGSSTPNSTGYRVPNLNQIAEDENGVEVQNDENESSTPVLPGLEPKMECESQNGDIIGNNRLSLRKNESNDIPSPASYTSSVAAIDPSSNTFSFLEIDDKRKSPDLRLSLQNAEQKKFVRQCLETMALMLIQHGCSEKDTDPLMEYVVTCKDSVSLYEIAHMLFILVVKGGPKVISCLINSCYGLEEFATVILFHIVHQPSEELRCTGIRILTHFYLRLETLPMAIFNTITSRRVSTKRNLPFAHRNSNPGTIGYGLQYLHYCGGLALLCEIMTAYSKYSSELTYSAILELLLSQPSTKDSIAISFTENPENNQFVNLTQQSFYAQNISLLMQTNSFQNRNGSFNSRSSQQNLGRNMIQRSVTFVAHYLSPERVSEEGVDMTNPFVLPIFFEIVPKLPTFVHDQIYSDLLALLKHSEGNRDGFCNSSSFHLCMHGLISQLADVESPVCAINFITTSNLLFEMERIVGQVDMAGSPGIISLKRKKGKVKPSNHHAITKQSTSQIQEVVDINRMHQRDQKEKKEERRKSKGETGELLRSWHNYEIKTDLPSLDYPEKQQGKTDETNFKTDIKETNSTPNLTGNNKTSNVEINFALGMKIYATLLQHAMETKGGWREIDRSISLSSESSRGYAVSQAISSHLLNDLTFNMRSHYRELQRLAKSASNSDNTTANDRLENMLSVMLTASHLALVDEECVLNGIVHFHICEYRHKFFMDLCGDFITSKQSLRNLDSAGKDEKLGPQITQSELRNLLDITEMKIAGALRMVDNQKMSQNLLEGDIDGNCHQVSGAVTIGLGEYPTYLDFTHEWFDIADNKSQSKKKVGETAQESYVPEVHSSPLPHNNDLPVTPTSTAAGFTSSLSTHKKEWKKQYDGHATPSSFMKPTPLVPVEDQILPVDHTLKSGALSLTLAHNEIKTKVSTNHGNISNPMPKSIEELLHPLERNHDLATGQLILVLQTLRYFDAVFWPNDIGPMRNVEMMRFIKESNILSDIANSTRSTVHSNQNNSYLNAALGVNQTEQIPGKSGQNTTSPNFQQLSIFSAVMRMCIFVCNNLSPVTHLAVLNLKRIKMLMNSLDKVQITTTPTHDWLLVTLLHVSLGLQRLSVALEPLFQFIGIEDLFPIQTVGPWNDSYDEYDRLSDSDVAKFEEFAEDRAKMAQIQAYFENPIGRNLLRNLRISFFILADAFELHHTKLSYGLEERTFRSLYVLVEHIKADVMSQAVPITHNASKFYKSLSKLDAISIDTAGDIYESSNSGPNSNSPIVPNISVHNVRRDRSFSDFSDTNSLNPDTEASNAADRNNFVTDMVEETFLSTDVLMILKWLRFPYFKINLFRNIGFTKALQALDFLEKKSFSKFESDLTLLKKNLETQRDIAIKSVEEMAELKELSFNVNHRIHQRYRTRNSNFRSFESLKLKNVAARWHECIQIYENDWPMSDSNEDENKNHMSSHNILSYEISKYRDSRLRKMMLTRSDEIIDYSNAAYLEGKVKDNELFHAGLTSSGATPVATIPRFSLPFKIKSNGDKILNSDNDFDGGDSDEDMPTTNQTSSSTQNATAVAAAFNNMADVTMGLFFQATDGDKRPQWTYAFPWSADEKIIYMNDATQINIDQAVHGIVLLTNRYIYFHAKKRAPGLAIITKALRDGRWRIDRLVEAYGRRYLLQNCAIELFFVEYPDLFLAFKSRADVQKIFRLLRRLPTPLLSTPRSLNPRTAYMNSVWTDLWRKRLISNFEYLMRLNILAGRSYNDITQYPVFPWIISDYESSDLDLKNPRTFRDLSKPVGALNPDRLRDYLERYKFFEDDTIPKFLYGSHYSSAGVVVSYLIRQEPFTSLAISLQGGRFDCPDRIFFDIKRTWSGCNNSMSDVKEMIPEMFCFPEALINSNKLPLGTLQEGGIVDDVRLPKWAKNAYEFSRINRQALESDYVSDHLNEWIDLIFGYKQRGPAAIAANNVFYYLTYENSINLDAIEDPLQRDAAKAQVIHFGQTPSQILSKEHPKRLPREECITPLFNDLSTVQNTKVYVNPIKASMNTNGSIIGIRCSSERLIVCHSDLRVSYYRWSTFPDGDGIPFTLRLEKTKGLQCANLSSSEQIFKSRSTIQLDPLHSIPTALSTAGNTNSDRRLRSYTITNRIRGVRSISSDKTILRTRHSSIDLMTSDYPPHTKTASFIHRSSSDGIPLEASAVTNDKKPANEMNTTTSNSNAVETQRSPVPSSLAGNAGAVFNVFKTGFLGRGIGIGFNVESEKGVHQVGESSNVLNFLPMMSSSKSEDNIQMIRRENTSASDDAKDFNTNEHLFHDSFANLADVNKTRHSALSSATAFTVLNQGHISLTPGDGPMQSMKLLSVGYWDNTLKMHNVDNLKELGSSCLGHVGGITCLQSGLSFGHVVITGGVDGTCRVWLFDKQSVLIAISQDKYFGDVDRPEGSYDVNISIPGHTNFGSSTTSSSTDPNVSSSLCMHVLCGHHSPIRTMHYSVDMDLLLSGSESGLLCLHSVRRGKLIRTISYMEGSPIDLVVISLSGYLVAHSWTSMQLYLFWLNGEFLLSTAVSERIDSFAINGSGNILVCGTNAGTVILREIWSLNPLFTLPLHEHGSITCLWFTEDYQYLFIGSLDGSFSIATDPEARYKMISAAIQKSPIPYEKLKLW